MRFKSIPSAVRSTVLSLRRAGFQGFLVGGAVRDLLLGRVPKDWDVATDAKPGDIEKLFSRTVAIGKKYGTIAVLQGKLAVQVTTFRKEGAYVGRRRPKTVQFVSSLEEDLSRRDFTMNAMALDLVSKKTVDPYNGLDDVKRGVLRTVGDADKRLAEDALRAVRAGRFISEFGLRPISELTRAARKKARHISELSGERIRDELSKLLLSPNPSLGLFWMEKTGILKRFLPELTKCKGVKQGGWHQFDVFRHTLETLDASEPDLTIRLALLLHDVAKPNTRIRDHRGYHFYGHDRIGAETAGRVLSRLRFSKEIIEDVQALIRHHLFEGVQIGRSDTAVRRLLVRVGENRVDRLLKMREADAKGCGKGRSAGDEIHALRKRITKIREARDAIGLKDLKASGRDIMRWKRLSEGKEIGKWLQYLLEQVLNKPSLNTRNQLKNIVTTYCI